MSFETRIEALDLSLFGIPSASSAGDKTSFLRAQRLIRRLQPLYTYLEIGSDRGGSLLPYLLDPLCDRIISIDPRPTAINDERATSILYPADGEAQMLANLATFAPVDRIVPICADIRNASPDSLPKAQIALIDGEHTNVACFSDAERLLDFIGEDAIILFHDANLIGDALQNYKLMLNRLGRIHSLVVAPDCVAVIGLGRFRDAVVQDFASVAFPEREYFERAQVGRWEMICLSVLDKMGLPQPSVIREVIQQRDNLDMHNIELRNEVAQLRALTESYRNSFSWKLTAPIRNLVDFLRKTKMLPSKVR